MEKQSKQVELRKRRNMTQQQQQEQQRKPRTLQRGRVARAETIDGGATSISTSRRKQKTTAAAAASGRSYSLPQVTRRQHTYKTGPHFVHAELEQLLSQIEQPSSPLPRKVRSQSTPPILTPPNSPRFVLDDGQTMDSLVPFAHNPQELPTNKRDALAILLSQSEQPGDHEGMLKTLQTEISETGDRSKDMVRRTLQMLPMALKPGESPYYKCFWEGHEYLKERQKLQEQLRPNDIRYKEVQILRAPSGEFFISRTLEQELKEEQLALEYIELELERCRQENISAKKQALNYLAMAERVELDREKKQISEWRAQHRQQLGQATEGKLQLPQEQQQQQHLKKVLPTAMPDKKSSNKKTSNKHVRAQSCGQLPELLKQRQTFQARCTESGIYKSSNDGVDLPQLYSSTVKHIVDELHQEAIDEKKLRKPKKSN